MTTLYLAWQHPGSRRWFPIGRLVRYEEGQENVFEFAYVHGAREAEKEAEFRPLPEFPSLDRLYSAPRLFPTFRNRCMNTSRADRAAYLEQLGLGVNGRDALAELSVSGGRSRTDSLQVFPAIEPGSAGRFRTKTPLHGLRYANPRSHESVQKLQEGDELGVALELDNPVTTFGFLVHTRDYCTLGWLPRYLAEVLLACCAWNKLDPKVSVARVNRRAPLTRRVLLEVGGQWPTGAGSMGVSRSTFPSPKRV